MVSCGIQIYPKDRISNIRFVGELVSFKVKVTDGGTSNNNNIKIFKRIPNTNLDKQIGSTITNVSLNTEKTINYVIQREDAGNLLDPSVGITLYKAEASYLCPADNIIRKCRTDGLRLTILILKSISMSAPKTTIKVGEIVQINKAGKDAFGNSISGYPKLTWLSSNTTVATVSSTGLVTGTSTGTVRITGKFVFEMTTVSNYIDIVVIA